MKLQHLAIIFVIIILPISMVISEYVQSQIDTISLQTQYNTKLQTATHDAIKAFQLNTLNNKYSSVSDSKIRDIEASVSTFYNSLGTELGASGYDKESMQQFVPAIVYTLYDGYYIYSKYHNSTIDDYQYGLKPFIYYSCRYINNNDDFVVNYTLDNTITVTGKINGSYCAKTGALIYPNLVTDLVTDINSNVISLKYAGISIEPEILKEQLVILMDDGNAEKKEFGYTIYSSQKIYIEEINDPQILQKLIKDEVYIKDGKYVYFRYQNNKKLYVSNSSSNSKEKEFLDKWTKNGILYCNSAIEYYVNAKEFSEWVNSNLSGITQQNAVDENGNKITDFAINTSTEPIFKLNDNNNPMLDSSTFNQNRISVIRRVIQTTLNTAIANYSSSANYDFVLPVFTEEDWERLVNNVSVASFMQGIPIGAKYYNNYCIMINNKNKEVVTKDSLYVITEDGEAHRAGSRDVIDKKKKVIEVYKNVDFEPQTVVGNQTYTYYPHSNARCYECLVNVAQTYDIDDIIVGEAKRYNKNTDDYEKDQNATSNINSTYLRQKYLTALARERQNLLY